MNSSNFEAFSETNLLNDDRVETKLHLSTFDDALFHGIFRNEAEDANLLLLTDTMGTVLQVISTLSRSNNGRNHCLQIHLRVPVRIVEHNNIGGR